MPLTEALHKMIAAAEHSLASLAQRDRARSLRGRRSTISLAGPSSEITAVDREPHRGRRSTISIATAPTIETVEDSRPVKEQMPIPEEHATP
jgi:hypothetical protein